MRTVPAWLAWLSALALVFAQPAAAAVMAQPAGSHTVQICSQSGGGKAITVEVPGSPAEKPDCNKCPACVLASAGAGPETPVVAPVFYATRAADVESRPVLGDALARAPPRPPSQAPPIS